MYVVHVMSKSAGDTVAAARGKGWPIYGEAIAAALGTDGSNYSHVCWNHAACHVLSPPLRSDPTTPKHLMDLLTK